MSFMIPEKVIHQDMLQVAHLLGEKLMAYKNSDAVIVAVPRGGVEVGYHLSNMLNLELEIIPCRKIKHPGYSNQSIGSVSIDEASIIEECRNVPQDYIYHQILLIQHTLNADNDYYRSGSKPLSLTNRTVILVDDVMQSGDSMKACLKSIKKQSPGKVLVAVLVTSPEASSQIESIVDELIALRTDKSNLLNHHFSSVTNEGVRDMLRLASVRNDKKVKYSDRLS
jgi:predicted phosphoribosyltransferase